MNSGYHQTPVKGITSYLSIANRTQKPGPQNQIQSHRNYRLSTRLSAPRIIPRSSRCPPRRKRVIPFSLLSSLPSPSIATRCMAFRASRSSSRSAHMRRTRDDTRSDMERYSSTSWTPAARESSVGPNPSAMRKSREDTADGGIGGNDDSDWPDGVEPVTGCCNDENIFCCDESRMDKSISSVCDADGWRCDGSFSSDSLGIGGLTRGIEGGRRSAFSECLSFCNLYWVRVSISPSRIPEYTNILLYLLFQLFDLLCILYILWMRFLDNNSWRCFIFSSKPIGQVGI